MWDKLKKQDSLDVDHASIAQLREFTFRWYDEVWNERRTGAIEQFMTDGDMDCGPFARGRELFQKERFREFHTQMLSAFPDLWFCVEEVLVDGDWTAARFVVSGHHEGEIDGLPATGRQFKVGGMVMIRWKYGKAVECMSNFDQLGLLQQLGVAN
jgi:predicted ester cyclase